MKRALLTGGTGFVGANLARRLLAEGHEVHLLVRPGYTGWRMDDIRPHVYLREVDLGDRDALDAAAAGVRPDWVFHLAAYGSSSWQTDTARIFATNVQATINLVEACLKTGFEALVNTGSSSEYGLKDHPPAEDELSDPNSAYAVSKLSATLYCRYVARSQKAAIRTLRLYSAFGPFEQPPRLLPTLIVRGLRGELPPLVNPDIARDYVYIDDVCDAYLLAAQNPAEEPGAVYNVGTGVQTSLAEVVAAARRIMRVQAEPQWGSMPDRRWDTTTWVADPRKIKARLGWAPRYGFEDGFARMVDWLRADPALLAFYEVHLTPTE